MLILNYVVDNFLINGSVSCVKNVVYRKPTGLWVSTVLSKYVVVDLLKLLIMEDNKFFPDIPLTWVTTATAKFQCENYCCLESTNPTKSLQSNQNT